MKPEKAGWRKKTLKDESKGIYRRHVRIVKTQKPKERPIIEEETP